MTKVPVFRGLAAAVIGLALAPAAAHAGWLFPEKGSPNADDIWTLYLLIFILATIVFVGVGGALLWAMVKFRARKGQVAAQIHGNTRLEIGWTVGAFLILVFITVFTFVTLPGIKNPPASDVDERGVPLGSTSQLYASTDQPPPPPGTPTLNIRVDGQQYVWRYQYPEQDGTRVFSYVDMVVPVGVTVTLDITADDVAHSWWIPKLGGKMDAVPGYTNKTWFKIPLDLLPDGQRSVAFNGQCAEFCGRGHANMLARVIGMRMPDYQAWVRGKAAEIKQAQERAAETRRRLQEEGGR